MTAKEEAYLKKIVALLDGLNSSGSKVWGQSRNDRCLCREVECRPRRNEDRSEYLRGDIQLNIGHEFGGKSGSNGGSSGAAGTL
jgi:hypothetical protein